MNTTTAMLVGVLAGLHISTWGMYKDALHEGFELRKYLRSVIIGGTIAPALALLTRMSADGPGALVVLFGVTYALERALWEFYKLFIRVEDQSKYFIPMQFAVRGRIVRGRAPRVLGGAIVTGLAMLLLVSALLLERSLGPHPSIWIVLAFGSAGGWYSAVGGAWKDAPIEGFETLKFFRSPALSGAYGLLLARFSDSLTLTALAALGFTIATLETYKKFCFPSVPVGKFAGKPVRFPDMVQRRRWFVPLFIGIWVLLIAGCMSAF